MALYRSLVLGLLGAIFLLIVESRIHMSREAPRVEMAVTAAPTAPTVVDVSRSATRASGTGPAAVIGAAPGERVVAINGAPGDEIALASAWVDATVGDYVDIDLDRSGHRRRVLVLMHP